jgi:hypothetical protein
MQPFLPSGSMSPGLIWCVLILAVGACVIGLARILRLARKEMKYRRREQQLRKWVQSDTPESHRRVRVEPP